MKSLLLLSDMWGQRQWQWLALYEQALQVHFQVQRLDVCTLGHLNTSIYESDTLHQQFLDGGITQAVNELLKFQAPNLYIIAFSIGGTIAWKAMEKGLQVKQCYAVSATRLRYETTPAKYPTKLFYGNNDPFRPNDIWLKNINLSYKLFPDQAHECYKNSKIAAAITHDFILTTKNF